MLAALRVLRRAAGEFERYSWLYIIANLLSVLLSLPIITAPAAYAGLSRLSHTAQTGTSATYDDFWSGFRAHFRRGVIMMLANLAILGMLWINFSYYGSQPGLPFFMLRAAWLLIFLVWIGVQLYLWPILEEMEQPTLRGGLRNAAVMLFQNPFFSLTLMAVLGLIALLSTLVMVPWLLITASIMACVSNAAVLNRLEAYRGR